MLTILASILPILVTVLLGFFAGWRKDVTQDQADVLNGMVMRYALPMLLVAGILSTPLSTITKNGDVFLWIFVGMGGGFLLAFAISRYLFRADAALSALRAFVIAGASVAVVGPTVLDGPAGQTDATLVAAAGSLVINLVQSPLTLILLSGAAASKGDGPWKTAWTGIRRGVSQPVVWAPVGAFALLLLGVELPSWLKGSFTTLGQATGGVALFAAGAVLYAHKIALSAATVVSVVAKNILLPGAVLLAMRLFHAPADQVGLTVVALAIPSSVAPVIFAVHYRVAEREIASTVFFSTLLSLLTLTAFIGLTGL